MAAESDPDAESPHVPIDIVPGPSGAEFSSSTLTVPARAILVWTNRTAESQVVQVDRRVLTLAPAGHEGAVALTAARGTAMTATAFLESNPAAHATITMTPTSA
ncbi:MAG TPA: hypothetical protein VN837_15565 [Chloroflexota bacterium]|nr:hypothetical protein [Chloroflexota bacterium]